MRIMHKNPNIREQKCLTRRVVEYGLYEIIQKLANIGDKKWSDHDVRVT